MAVPVGEGTQDPPLLNGHALRGQRLGQAAVDHLLRLGQQVCQVGPQLVSGTAAPPFDRTVDRPQCGTGYGRVAHRVANCPEQDDTRPVAGIVRIALVAPVSGTLGLIGPGAINCAALAAQEINEVGGLLGRSIELTLVDGGRPAVDVAAEVAALVGGGRVQAVVGVHPSDVRLALVGALGARVPYVYTPPYEGGERAPGVYLAGETPDRQVPPGAALAGRAQPPGPALGLLGNDYVWPRRVHARRRGTTCGRSARGVVAERYVPRGAAADPEPLLDAVAASGADAVLVTLIGGDLVDFNRAFAGARGSAGAAVCAALEENGLLGVGGDATGELYATMGYFASVATDAGLDFVGRYAPASARWPRCPAATARAATTACGCWPRWPVGPARWPRPRGRGRGGHHDRRRPRPSHGRRPPAWTSPSVGPRGRPGLRRVEGV